MMLYKYTSSSSMVKEFDNAKKKKNQYCVRDISFQIRNINFKFVSKEWETQGQRSCMQLFSVQLLPEKRTKWI